MKLIHMHHCPDAATEAEILVFVGAFMVCAHAVCATPTRSHHRYAAAYRLGLVLDGPLVTYQGRTLAWHGTSWMYCGGVASTILDEKVAEDLLTQRDATLGEGAPLNGWRNAYGEHCYPGEVWTIPAQCRLIGLYAYGDHPWMAAARGAAARLRLPLHVQPAHPPQPICRPRRRYGRNPPIAIEVFHRTSAPCD